MWTHRIANRTAHCLLALVLAFPAALSQAAGSSALSRWLSRETGPELQQLLGSHPRYRGQRVQVVETSGNALGEAVVTVIRGQLTGHEGIHLVRDQSNTTMHQPLPLSIDELDCGEQTRSDYQLLVSAQKEDSGQGLVQIELLDTRSTEAAPTSWQWRGSLSSAERRYLKKPPKAHRAGGTLAAPWKADSVQLAAAALSREFACSLRPQVKTRISLQWSANPQVPAVFADTSNASRHLLGTYRELAISDSGGDYIVKVRLEQFMQDTWQLWLTGTPTGNRLAPVQAVTYFKLESVDWPQARPERLLAEERARPPLRAARVAPPANLGEPLDFIAVELLDATQTDSGNSRADLQVTVRIGNRADWPIEYSFSLSGGHFNHCIARPEFYRHDRYGVLQGSIGAGDSVVQRMVIKNTRHRPKPWFGERQCAGFRDLEGFEEFASQGYRVTDFVRWEM